MTAQSVGEITQIVEQAVVSCSLQLPAAVSPKDFCGRAQMLSSPTAILLQYFSPDADVLVLRDPSQKAFTDGIAGYADTFPGLVDALRGEFDFGRYRTLRCIGTSSGGAAAIAAGALLGASPTASFCGHLSRDQQRTNPLATDIDGTIENATGSAERFFAVFGQDNPHDRANAENLARVFALTLYPVPGIEAHNVVRTLHDQGRLAGVLADLGLTGAA
jgi:hypothetical protein